MKCDVCGREIKKRKLDYTLGSLNYIEIPEDWRKCKGIITDKNDTNPGFANRDYSVECKSHNLMIVEGYWIWWCDIHNQPLAHCEEAKLKTKIRELEIKIKKAKDALNLIEGNEK